MKVLQLVNSNKSFFQNQVKGLEQNGVTVDTLFVPKSETIGETADQRSVTDYLQYYPSVLKHSFEDYDVIHSNYGLTAPFAILQPNRPIVLTLWGSDLMGKHGNFNRYLSRYFDTVILPSTEMANYLHYEYEIVPFGIDTELFRPMDQKQARSKIGWDTEDRIVLFPYPKHRSEKNYSLAKQVVDEINKSVDNGVKIKTIVGKPYYKMPMYMNASDVLLITSERESGPMTVKEAALCNVPVVSTNVGFADAVLEGVKNSFVCDDKQDIITNLSYVLDEPVRSDGRKQADMWGTKEMGRKLKYIYQTCIE